MSQRPNTEELAAPATQVVRDRDAYLGASRDVGRRLTEDQVELFVADEPAAALQRELERLRPQYIALHDVGASTSLRLLQTMAATTGQVLRLSIRRQGHGMALATIRFVEIKGSDGSRLRVYSTDVDADTHARHELARVLVSHARLSVLVFGDLPTHAMAAALQPMTDALTHERWPNRDMLLVPLGTHGSLSGFATAFGQAGIRVKQAQRVGRASDTWSLIGTAWNELDGVVPESPAAPTPPAAPAPAAGDGEEPTQPMGLAATQTGSAPQPPVEPYGVNWGDYVIRCAGLKGIVSVCVFDRRTGQALAHAGARPSAELLQTLGERMLVTASEMGAMMGTGSDVQEATVSTGSHHLLLRALPRQPGMVVHAVLDGPTGNLTLLRTQIARLDPA